MSARELSSEATDTEREVARAEAEGIAARWVPRHMTARQGLVDDIASSLINARRLERDESRWVRRYIAVRVLAFLFGTAVMLAVGAGYVAKVAWELRGALGK